MSKPVVFCALETYSKVGGLQAFNKRVIRHLGSYSGANSCSATKVLLLRDDSIELPKVDGVDIVPFRTRYALGLAAVRNAKSADVLVLGHVNLLPIAVCARLLMPNIPIILFVHGDEVWNAATHRKKRWYEPWALKSVTLIASVSRFTATKMSAAFNIPFHKFTIFPNAVDVAIAPDRAQTSPLVLTVCRMGHGDREKHVDKVIRAFQSIKAKMPDARYVIVGEGDLRREYETLVAELALSDHVSFVGRVDDEALQLLYSRAAVFVMASSKEGFGIVYLEAWLHRLPVICSTEGASHEIVDDGVDGYCVDPNDIPALSGRIVDLLSNPDLRRRFGEAGREKVLAHYDDARFAERLRDLLRSAAALHNA